MSSLITTHSFAGPSVASFAGVYKVRAGSRPGGNGRIENILEIVRQSDQSFYFRMHTEGPVNGCICGLWGLAEASNGQFVYFDKIHEGSKVIFKPSSMELAIEYAGSNDCGHCPAGMIEKFPMKARKPIRYLERLKRSRQYQEVTKMKDTIKQENE